MTTIRTENQGCIVCAAPFPASSRIASAVDFEYATCDNEFEFHQCSACRHVFLRQRPTAADLPRLYPAHYGNYSSSLQRNLAYRVKAILEGRAFRRYASALPSGGKVLDIGCGDGRVLDIFNRLRPDGISLYGQEIADEVCDVVAAKGYGVFRGAFEAVDLGAHRFDLVTMVQVIEHFLDPDLALQKIRAHLASDGLVIMETPSIDCWDFRLFRRRYWGGYHVPRHINLFNPDNIRTFARNNGFRVRSIEPKLQPVHWIWSLHHLLMERGFPKALYRTLNIRNPFWLGIFTLVELVQVGVFRQSSNMRVVLSRC